jgi:peptidoglycan hydrolase CwlO-like protein
MHIKRHISLFLSILGIVASLSALAPLPGLADSSSDLQSQIDADNAQIAALNAKIAEYQAALQQIGADKKTLQAAISALDLQRSKVQAQVAVTQRQINTTQLQIQQLGGQIDDTKNHIEESRGALADYLKSIQQSDDRPLLVQVLSDGNLSQFWDDFNSALTIQDSVRQKTDSLEEQQSTLTQTQTAAQEKKDQLAAQKSQLASQQQSLTATEQSKNQLLKETKAQESSYQKLLAQAQAELKSYSDFTKNAGGAGILGNETICDDWGCYYNQRDSAWGSTPLNGTQFTLASDGCLITSMAMIMSHYGHRVTPATINANPANFASYYPAFLLYSITAGGVTATRKTSTIDGVLATGNPVVVGLHAYGGTHFVVLVSGSNGHYIMRDPYVSNGKDISFTSHYTIREIYSIARVEIS